MSDKSLAARARAPESATKVAVKRESRVTKHGIKKYSVKGPYKRKTKLAGERQVLRDAINRLHRKAGGVAILWVDSEDAEAAAHEVGTVEVKRYSRSDTAALRELVTITTAAATRHFAGMPEEQRSVMLERVKRGLAAAGDSPPSNNEVLAELRRVGAFGIPVDQAAAGDQEDDRAARDFKVDIPAANRAALERAFARAEINKVEVLKRPDMLRGEEIGERMNLSRARVDQLRVANQLLALELGTKRGLRYPAWQCDLVEDATVRAAFVSVLATLAKTGPWSRYRFFVQPAPALGGRTPVEALKAGEGDAVRRAAESWAVGEQGGH